MPRSVSEARIRPIEPRDDAAVAAIIREVMTEHGASGPGFAIHDPEVAAMSAAYQPPRAGYFVIDEGGRVLGGAGFGPLVGGPEDVCELRKMYFLPAARGRGLGGALLDRVLGEARAAGFARCYLETLASMEAARKLYRKKGFATIDAAMGATGHFGCNAFMLRAL